MSNIVAIKSKILISVIPKVVSLSYLQHVNNHCRIRFLGNIQVEDWTNIRQESCTHKNAFVLGQNIASFSCSPDRLFKR